MVAIGLTILGLLGCGGLDGEGQSNLRGLFDRTPEPTATLAAPATSGQSPSAPRPRNTPEAAATAHLVATPLANSIFSPVQAQGFNSDAEGWFEECLQRATDRIESGIVLSKMRETDVSRLTDAERFQWRAELLRDDNTSNQAMFFACASFWSEPVTLTNGHRRNWNHADSCFHLKKPSYSNTAEIDDSQIYRQVLSFEAKVQEGIWELLLVPFHKLSATDRILLRGALDLDRTNEDAFLSDLEGCRAFYPQLIMGRWIPLDVGNAERVDRSGFLGIYDGTVITCEDASVEETVVDGWQEWSFDYERDACIRQE